MPCAECGVDVRSLNVVAAYEAQPFDEWHFFLWIKSLVVSSRGSPAHVHSPDPFLHVPLAPFPRCGHDDSVTLANMSSDSNVTWRVVDGPLRWSACPCAGIPTLPSVPAWTVASGPPGTFEGHRIRENQGG